MALGLSLDKAIGLLDTLVEPFRRLFWNPQRRVDMLKKRHKTPLDREPGHVLGCNFRYVSSAMRRMLWGGFHQTFHDVDESTLAKRKRANNFKSSVVGLLAGQGVWWTIRSCSRAISGL